MTKFAIGGVMAIVGLVFGLVGFVVYEIKESYKDYEQVADCLKRHGFEVEGGWQHQDVFLEDFGWIFTLSDGQRWEVQILEGYSPRDCQDQLAGIFLSSDGFAGKQYLSFESPELQQDLSGQEIRTMDDMFARFEWLLDWAKAHPEALLTHDEMTAREGVVSLLSPPL